MAEWRNRIISQRMVDAAELRAHPMNPRRHPQGQKSAVVGLLNEVGIVDSLTVYDSVQYGGLTVLDGHLRRDMGGLWPVNVLDVTDEEAALILATFDFTTSLAELDGAALADLLARVEMTPVEDDGVRDLLAQLAAEHVPAVAKSDVDAEAQVDRAEELRVKWGVETGQLWQLGEHRLICGDCTDAAVVARVMGGEKAQILLTDPPYSSGGFQEAGKTSGSIGTRSSDVIAMDNLSTRGYGRLLGDVFRFSGATDVLYLFTDWRMWIETFDAAERGGWRVRNMLVWDKEQMGMGMPWRNQHELILFGKRTSAKIMDGKQGNVLKNPRSGNINHPTEKPVELLVNILTNTEGEVVYDPFSGSGTTIMACEQLGRRARAIEISPAYVAVALQRYADATGQQPTLLEAA